MNKPVLIQRGRLIAWQRLPAAIAAGLLAITLAPSALAQSDQDESYDAYLLEEVIVTAQRREQIMQEVPMAISAFEGEQLAELQYPVESNACRNDYVGLGQPCHDAGESAVTDRQRVAVGEDTPAIIDEREGDAGLFHKGFQGGITTVHGHAAATDQ